MNEWTKTPLRMAALVLGIAAAVSMFLLFNPWFDLSGTVNNLTTWVFWIASIALLLVLYFERKDAPESDQVDMEGPAFARFLFNNRRAGLFWLPIDRKSVV